MQILVDTSAVLQQSLGKALDYITYFEQVKIFSENKKTSGADQSQSLIDYTSINYQRMKRLNKTISIDENAVKTLQSLQQKQTWLVLTEAWCGDSAQVTPVLNKIAEATPAIDLKFVYRDEHLELMDTFLTNGGRSIPKLIALDTNLEVLSTWGPRPSVATQMVADYKEKHGMLTPEFKQDLQLWYTKDKGKNIVDDLLELLTEV